jgi:hypothetical protein
MSVREIAGDAIPEWYAKLCSDCLHSLGDHSPRPRKDGSTTYGRCVASDCHCAFFNDEPPSIVLGALLIEMRARFEELDRKITTLANHLGVNL